MKFIDYYLSQASRTLSILAGLLTGGISAIVFGWEIGVFVGAGTIVLASFLIPLLVYRADLPFLKRKAELPQPLLLDQRVRFVVGNTAVTGFMVLTNEKIVLLSSGKEQHEVQLSREEVKRVVEDGGTGINLFLSDTQYVRILSPFCEEIYGILQENSWT